MCLGHVFYICCLVATSLLFWEVVPKCVKFCGTQSCSAASSTANDGTQIEKSWSKCKNGVKRKINDKDWSQLQVQGFLLSTCGKTAMWLRTIAITSKYTSVFNTGQIVVFDLFLCSFNPQNKKM